MKLKGIQDLQGVDVWLFPPGAFADLVSTLRTASAVNFPVFLKASVPIFEKIHNVDMFLESALQEILAILLRALANLRRYSVSDDKDFVGDLILAVLNVATVTDDTWEQFNTLGGVTAITEASPKSKFSAIPMMRAIIDVFAVLNSLSDPTALYSRYEWAKWNQAVETISRIRHALIPITNPLFKCVASLIYKWAFYGKIQYDLFPGSAGPWKSKHVELLADLMLEEDDPFDFKGIYARPVGDFIQTIASSSDELSLFFVDVLLDADMRVFENDDAFWKKFYETGSAAAKSGIRAKEWTLSLKDADKTLTRR